MLGLTLNKIVQGTTASIRFQLLDAGAPLVGGLSGITVTLLLCDRFGTTVSTTGMVAVEDATNCIVSLTPTLSTMFDPSYSPYHARWVLTDSLGKISYIPDDVRDLWYVVAQ